MSGKQNLQQQMSLFTCEGERKYLSPAERERFYGSLAVIANPAERSFCEMIYWTGCRPSEALALTPRNIDVDGGAVIIRSLKKRGDVKGRHFRPVPVPSEFIARMSEAHDLEDPAAFRHKLWDFGRTKGWRLIRAVMDEAEITGVRGCARGLRHALGVHAAIMHVPEARLQSWLGHANLSTTGIYIDAVGPEDRAIARRMWQ